jgi:hypothetical protein
MKSGNCNYKYFPSFLLPIKIKLENSVFLQYGNKQTEKNRQRFAE